MVSVLNEQVGEILDKVHELGIAENTLILFTSDNDPHIEAGVNPDSLIVTGPLEAPKDIFMKEEFAFL